jgi:predicted transcriptional regulator
MELHLSPDVQAKLDRLVSETGRAPDKVLEDAMAGYEVDLSETREMLDSRYDDFKSGRVKPIPGEEVVAYFREKSAAARRLQPGSLPNTSFTRKLGVIWTKFGNSFAQTVLTPLTE